MTSGDALTPSPAAPPAPRSGDVLDDLAWRGLVAQSTDLGALRAHLDAGPVVLYAGFDPTADSLHVGNLMPLLTLRRFQLYGHRPVALAGGATGFIGDPSGRATERSLLTADIVAERVHRIRAQLERFLDFEGDSAATLADNMTWTGPLSALDFLRDVGKHFSVNAMLQKESVSTRLAAGGISYTEFSYMLLQSNDYLELFRRHGCTLQLGGSDQWGNITAGLDLVRRVAHGTAHGLTVPLVTSATGQKFGKSTGGGALWLDPGMTSSYALYQYFLNTDDRDVGSYLRYLTFLSQEEVLALDDSVATRPGARQAQRRLAEQVVTLVHGQDELAGVQQVSAALFGGGDLSGLDEPTLTAVLAEIPSTVVTGEPPPYVQLLARALGVSTSDARRAVREGGAYVNNVRLADETATPSPSDWLHGRFLVLRRGRRSVAVAERRPG